MAKDRFCPYSSFLVSYCSFLATLLCRRQVWQLYIFGMNTLKILDGKDARDKNNFVGSDVRIDHEKL